MCRRIDRCRVNKHLFGWIASAAAGLLLGVSSAAAKPMVSESEARKLAFFAVMDTGYPPSRLWIGLEPTQLDECSSDYYCFTVRVNAGAWSPVIANSGD
jgi:hypothetical protein